MTVWKLTSNEDDQSWILCVFLRKERVTYDTSAALFLVTHAYILSSLIERYSIHKHSLLVWFLATHVGANEVSGVEGVEIYFYYRSRRGATRRVVQENYLIAVQSIRRALSPTLLNSIITQLIFNKFRFLRTLAPTLRSMQNGICSRRMKEFLRNENLTVLFALPLNILV